MFQLTRRTQLLQPFLITARTTRTRSIHQRVPTPYPIENGLPEFLSPNALRTIAVDWQQGILDKVNELSIGTEYEGLSAYQTVKSTASDPTQSILFNYASEALNNSFFLSTLSPTPRPPSPISSLSLKLSSLSPSTPYPSLLSSISSHISGLHPSSSGAYVWLVCDKTGELGIVGTYAGGSLLVDGRGQRGGGGVMGLSGIGREREMRGEVLGEVIKSGGGGSEEGEAGGEEGEQVSAWLSTTSDSTIPSSSSSSTTNSTKPSSTKKRQSLLLAESLRSYPPPSSASTSASPHLHPLLCISLHPHNYLGDYGLWGRQIFVERWWKFVEWGGVEDRYERFVRRTL